MTNAKEIQEKQIDLILGKAKKALETSVPRAFNGTAPSGGDMTEDRLLAAYEALASIVSTHGEIYLPLFERLHHEIQKQENHSSFVSLARAIHERRLGR